MAYDVVLCWEGKKLLGLVVFLIFFTHVLAFFGLAWLL